MQFDVRTDRLVTWREFADLMRSVGWGDGYDEASFLRSSGSYPFVAHARAQDGSLIGYVTAFSDGAFTTMLGELAVRPDAQGNGVGRALMSAVEAEFPNVPIYVKALGEAKHFFGSCGYRVPSSEMTVMFKKTPAKRFPTPGEMEPAKNTARPGRG